MKIKKQGRLFWWDFVCENCDCEFEANQYETELYDGEGRVAKCPNCGQVVLSTGKIPEGVLENMSDGAFTLSEDEPLEAAVGDE